MTDPLAETGLSFDDRPIQPVQQGGRWVCPIDGKEVLQRADGTWTHKPSQAFLDAFGITLEQHLAERIPRTVDP